MTSERTKAACRKSIETDGFSDDFRRDIAPMIEALRKQFEAEDAALLALHPGAQR